MNSVSQFSNVTITLSAKRRTKAGRLLKTAFLLAGLLLLLPKAGTGADVQKTATDPLASLKLLAVHSHRYQNFEENRIGCEIFGEFQNIGTRKVQGFTLEIKLLDAKNKTVGQEDLDITPLSISRENPKGIAKAIEPKGYGYFNMDTTNCPASWLEGKVKYRLKSVNLE